MAYALIEHDPRIGLDTVKEVADAPHGAETLRWVDLSKVAGVAVGWVLGADGSLAPYVPPLAEAQRIQLGWLDSLCAAAITGGFTSSALGAPHSYGSSATDQANLDRAALASITAGDGWTAKVKCAAVSAAAAFTPHNAEQLHGVVIDLHAWIEGCRLKLDGLKARVAAATTAADVQAVAWS